MSRFHAVYDRKCELEPASTSLWWRRAGGHRYHIKVGNPEDPWMASIEVYDHLAVELPVDQFRVVEFEPIPPDSPVRLPRKHLPFLDILAPFPPSITGWRPLTRTGDHGWPGYGDDGYSANLAGYACYTWGTRPLPEKGNLKKFKGRCY